MEPTPDPALAAAVAAWHNRHPLARRVTTVQVQGWGVVALPFTAAGKAGGKTRLRSAFTENIIAPLTLRSVARFALRHGTATRPGPDDWPQRRLSTTAHAASAPTIETRFLRTAAIDVRNQRTRVLIGAGPHPELLGPHLWSRPRVLTAAILFGTVMLGVAALVGRVSVTLQEDPKLAAAAPVAAAASAAPAAPAASTPAAASSHAASGAVAQLAAASRSAASHRHASAASWAASASALPSAAPGQIATAETASATRDIRPALSPELRTAAQQHSRQLRADKLAGNASTGPGDAASAGATGRTFAVATPPTRTRAAAHLRIVLMNAPTETEPGQPHAEVMQTGDGWRTVVWPYASRAAAERTRASLAERGIAAEVIEF